MNEKENSAENYEDLLRITTTNFLGKEEKTYENQKIHVKINKTIKIAYVEKSIITG